MSKKVLSFEDIMNKENKSAKQLFEEFGYVKKKTNYGLLLYEKKHGFNLFISIQFDENIEEFGFLLVNRHGERVDDWFVGIKELVAINQQVKELGWKNE